MDTKNKNWRSLWGNICRISKKMVGEDNILLVSHHDADGITACAIMLDLFQSIDKNVDFMIIKQLDSTTVSKINEIDHDTIVFTDMGSGQISLLRENKMENFYIIDHHPPESVYENQLNPHFYGYDGAFEISGSGMAYLVAKSLNHMEMAPIAIVGAVGDMQDSDGKLHSLNRIILQDGIDQGLLKVKHDLRLFGRQSRPLVQMLTYSSDPVIPGLTGNQNACVAFLENLGIELKRNDDSWRSYVDLSREEREKLTTALYIHLLDSDIPEFVIQGMIGEVYTLLNEEKHTELRDAKEFATVMNACGRQEQPEIGVRVCLGDRDENWKKAKNLLRFHRKKLREGLEFLSNTGVEKLENLYYFDSNGRIDENIIGVIAGMAYGAGIIPPDRPILAFADDKENPALLKVSARANWNLVRRGIHLGNVMSGESRKLGGEGGGHDIAAGARIPKERKDEFLSAVNKSFAKQVRKS